MRTSLILFILLSTSFAYANTTCEKYMPKILPWYEAHSGMRSWQDSVSVLCVSPELDALEVSVQQQRAAAESEVQSLTSYKEFAKSVAETVRAQAIILKDWETRLRNCKKSSVNKIDCSDLQLEMKTESGKILSALGSLKIKSRNLPDLQRQQLIIRLEHARLIQSNFVFRHSVGK